MPTLPQLAGVVALYCVVMILVAGLIIWRIKANYKENDDD